MSLNVFLVSVDTIKECSGVHDNVDDKMIAHEIKVAQDTKLELALGTPLFKRIQEGIVAKDLTENETLLLDNYIKDALVWFTVSALPLTASFQIYTKGMMQKSSDNSVLPSRLDISALSELYENRAEHYRERLIRYLSKNKALFPLYTACASDDGVTAINTGFRLPFGLERT